MSGIGEEDFERVRELVERALAQDPSMAHTADDIRDGIHTGQFQLWAGVRSAVVTQILKVPRTQHLHFFLAAGHLDELEWMLKPILDWARTKGCTYATLTGRRGWERSFLKDLNWRLTAIQMGVQL